jgi:hypothetical protein
LESLDISLSTWSMIIFLFQALFYTGMTLIVLGGKLNVKLYMFVIVFFILNQILFVLYGFQTNQIGFILIVVFQFFLLLLTQIYLSNASEEEL